MRRRHAARLLAFLLFLPASSIHAQQDEAAWALWATAMDRITGRYYQEVSEQSLTEAAVKHIIERTGPAAIRLQPAGYGANPKECREVFRKFIIGAAALPGRRTDAFGLTETALEEIAAHQLDFCKYDRLADVEASSHAGDASPGLRLDIQADGRLLCRPREGASAWRAGIRFGDELISIDDQPLKGLSRLRVRSLLRGSTGSVAMLQTSSTSGKVLRTGVRREVEPPSRPGLDTASLVPVLRIPEFTHDTPAALSHLLESLPPQSWLTIDLRGNSGGDLNEAVDCAAMFLTGPRPINVCTKKSHSGAVPLSSKQECLVKLRGILILVDGGTASSAELFTLALLEGCATRVTIGGTKTYGKGLYQEQQVLDGGGSLALTVGQLATMKGTIWHKTGIQPTFGGK